MTDICPGRSGFDGRVAIVTGGGKDMGRDIALKLAAEGADIAVVFHRDREGADATAAQVREKGRRAIAVRMDVADEASVSDAVDETASRLGRIDMLVNNAGRGFRAPLVDLPVAEWETVFAVNVTGCFLCARTVARHMIEAGRGGSIVNIAGASAHRSWPGAGAFAPSKAALVNLTQQMALEWADVGIRVNGVSPGPIFPPESDWQVARPDLTVRFDRLPLRRPGTPREVARAVAFLCSDDSTYITGHMLPVDGGSTLTWYMTR